MSKRGLPETLRMRHDEHYVESLAASAGQPVGKIVPIELLDPNPNQPRQAMGDLSELIASVGTRPGRVRHARVRARRARSHSQYRHHGRQHFRLDICQSRPRGAVGEPHVRLQSPSGAWWTWNEPDERNRVEGSAVEFCQVVAQTRNIGDTALRVSGEIAHEWMSMA